ncbi:MAG: HepT-like ribonuclease domain-containing protein [Alphaproteobacteria bacterium]|nr:HepT-like ribonuclease domain-containing protein [Alphaproteobacteria bacterium]
MTDHDDGVYFEHILKCIEDVRGFVDGKIEKIHEDKLLWSATLRVLQIMSESATKLSEPTKLAMPAIQWPRIRGFRNLLVHDYLGNIEPEIVCHVLQYELPILEKEINRMLAQRREK